MFSTRQSKLLNTLLYRRFYSVKSLGVIGAGQMGTGIAIVGAMNAKIQVTLLDSSQSALQNSLNFVQKYLQESVQKKKITEDERKEIEGRFHTSDKLEDFQNTDFVVEAIAENAQVKEKLFRQLSQITKPDTILATNTSSIPITQLANCTNKQDKVIGMHFMNPVPKMSLVEVIRSDFTSDDTYNKTIELAKLMGKETTLCKKDVPGFIANRILMGYLNEAIIVFEDGIASVEDIDKTMLLGTNVPMGPLKLADFIGLDTCLAILNVLHRGLKDDKFKPSKLLEQMVSEGKLGKKVGKGFYVYNK